MKGSNKFSIINNTKNKYLLLDDVIDLRINLNNINIDTNILIFNSNNLN